MVLLSCYLLLSLACDDARIGFEDQSVDGERETTDQDDEQDTIARVTGTQHFDSRLTRDLIDLSLSEQLGWYSDLAQIHLSPDSVAFGFDISTNDSDLLYTQRQLLAEDAAMIIRDFVWPEDFCLGVDSSACFAAFYEDHIIPSYGIFRAESERIHVMQLFESFIEDYGLKDGAALTLEYVLQTPFFYERYPYTETELALGRLSYENRLTRASLLILGRKPDAELKQRSAELRAESEEAGFEQLIREMLDMGQAWVGLSMFARDWLDVTQLEGIQRDSEIFPGFDQNMRLSYRNALIHYVVEHFMREGDTFESFYLGDQVAVDDNLATFFGYPIRNEDGIYYVEAGSPDRIGLLGQPGFLALQSNPDQANPIKRGVFIRERILCHHLPDPPPDVILEIEPPAADSTTRERFEAHTNNPACIRCHNLIDPIGHGLGRFDPVGRHVETEGGHTIDTSARLVSLGWNLTRSEHDGDFDGLAEMAQRFYDAGSLQMCLAQKIFTYTRPGADIDDETLSRLSSHLASAEGNIKELLIQVLLDPMYSNLVRSQS